MPFEIDFDAVIKLLSPLLVALIGGMVKRYTEAKPKLITYLVHSVAHPLPGAVPDPADAQGHGVRSVHTHTIVVMNTGKKTAHNVRIDHAIFPGSYVVNPPVNHTVTHGQGDSAEILIPTLVPKEQISVSYLYFPPLTWNQIVGWVKCDEGMAKAIQVIPSTPPPKPLQWFLWTMVFVGASTIVYWLLKALPYVLR